MHLLYRNTKSAKKYEIIKFFGTLNAIIVLIKIKPTECSKQICRAWMTKLSYAHICSNTNRIRVRHLLLYSEIN